MEMVYKQRSDRSQLVIEVPIHDNITVAGAYEKIIGEVKDPTVSSDTTGQSSVNLKFRFSFK